MNKSLLTFALTSLLTITTSQAADTSTSAKKRILLVTTSVGFRHPSVSFAEQSIRDIAEKSGDFVVVSTSDSPDFPTYPAPQEFETAGKADAGPNMTGGPPPGAGSPSAMAGGAGSADTLEKVRKVLAQYMSAVALKNYDAVFFVNTNGELPLPDAQAFLDWIKAGHGYLGTHSASDTLHTLPGYLEMLGAEFDHHGKQEIVTLTDDDPNNALAKPFGKTMVADDEWYLFKPGYDRSKVHSLYSMTAHPNDKTSGHYPVAWCKTYGNGRVFYTSQGHRFDIWDANWVGTDGQRTNSPEAVAAFRASLLAAMRWTTGLTQANCQP